MRLPERVAKSVLEAALPGSRIEFRTPQSNREWDFDLWLADGTHAAVEVTASADARQLQFLSVLGNERKGGQFVTAERCQQGWYVHPAEGARIDRIRHKIDEYLWPIEVSGLTEFFAPLDAYKNEAVARIWRDMRIEAGNVMRWTTPRLIGIAAPGRGGWLDPDNIAKAVEQEASRRDNVDKLQASGLSERHLLVFVDASNHLAWGPMVNGGVPDAGPELSSAITHAWAVSSSGALHRFRTLLFTREHWWRDFGLVDAIGDPDP